MAWAQPQYAKEEVNAAAEAFIDFLAKDPATLDNNDWAAYDHALAVINNWRACHGYPLNTFQMNLRHAARRIDNRALVAQRTKRLISIVGKLLRFKKMKLTQMQDIGGCRAVVRSVAGVRKLDNYYIRTSQIKHELATRDDYIDSPRSSGYRGVHLVYRYLSDKAAKEIYNGLKIEMQIRSQYQHAWATAVETVGTFVRETLKSSQGSDDWLRFFALMGTAIAYREKTPPVPNTPTDRKELLGELEYYVENLNVPARLRAYGEALRTFEQDTSPNAHYYLLQLDPAATELVVSGFRRNELSEAQDKYAAAERLVKENPGTDAVLVSVESLAALPRAYPNYFADTRVFVDLVHQAIKNKN